MKLKLPKIKFLQIFLSLKVIWATIAITAIIVLIALSWFLYNNLYLAITRSQEIIVLKSEVAPYSVNIENFNSSLEALEKKIHPQDSVNWQEINNPLGPTPVGQPVVETGNID